MGSFEAYTGAMAIRPVQLCVVSMRRRGGNPPAKAAMGYVG